MFLFGFTYTAVDTAVSSGKCSRKRTAIVSPTSLAERLNYTTQSSVRRVATGLDAFGKLRKLLTKRSITKFIHTRPGSVLLLVLVETEPSRGSLQDHIIQWTVLTNTRRGVKPKDLFLNLWSKYLTKYTLLLFFNYVKK